MSNLYNHSFIPPYILNKIIDNGTEEQKNRASLTIEHVNNLLNTVILPYSLNADDSVGEYSSMTSTNHIYRCVYNAYNKEELPGWILRQEGAPSTNDIAADEAYQYLGVTHEFFWKNFRRNSLNNKGLPLNATVHFGNRYQNAFWDGRLMVFGDGDGEIFNRFTVAPDIVAHELSHGIIESTANLLYIGQSGALNESISDVFGSMVKQFLNNQTVYQADWNIGEGLLTSYIRAKGLRSMSEPGSAYNDRILGKDPQPGHMKNYIHTNADNGGVHLNSGIPNRAFYLSAMEIGGYAWRGAGKIWYETLCDKNLGQSATFKDFAYLTVEHAGNDRNNGKKFRAIVENAWIKVGVLHQTL